MSKNITLVRLSASLLLCGLAFHAQAVPQQAALERDDPARVTLTWTMDPADAGTQYRVRVATSPEFPAEVPVQQVQARLGRLTLRHAAGQRPYVQIEDAAGVRMVVAERLLPLQGGVNFRDLGGYTTGDGASVRWGKLFRSGDNSALTDADHASLRALGIRTVCDLRSNDERSKSPTRAERFGEGVAYIAWDYEQLMDAGMGEALRNSTDPARTASELMVGFYRQMPTAFADRFRTVFATLAQGEGMLFHCSAGKDRTGLTAALLLSALGVEREQIMADYLLTNRYTEQIVARHTASRGDAADNPALAMFARLPAEVREAFMGVKPEYLQAALDSIDAQYGSMDVYLSEALGLDATDLRALRTQYLMPAPR